MSHTKLPNLKEILSSTSTPKLLSDDDSDSNAGNEEPLETLNQEAPEGYCVECQDQQAVLNCEDCKEAFCEVCFNMIHRTGSRANHSTVALNPAKLSGLSTPIKQASTQNSPKIDTPMEVDAHLPEPHQVDVDFNSQSGIATPNGIPFSTWMIERTKFIPLRLTHLERRKLRLLESALHVSEYTDKIDIYHSGSKHQRIVQQIKNTCAILSGLMVACDYKKGQELFASREFHENEAFFQSIFEVGRRYKIMNPERMRSTYGKLMYLLQDSQINHVLESLQFNCVKPIETVYSFLKDRGGLDILNHEYLALATREIIPEGKPRNQIQSEIKQKEKAIKFLSNKYQSKSLSVDDIETCLYSIGDNHSFLRTNRDPCDKMIQFLVDLFHPDRIESPELSLSIQMGRAGARLSHSHQTQFYYVQQTLTLWREILHDMFQLWYYSDSDLLNPNVPYRLRDTGQGLNRMQPCAQVSKLIHQILHRAQQRAGHWVGSSVIHLADSNVPNAFMFIDKYNQVSRILNPIVLVINYLDKFVTHKHKLTESDKGILEYIDDKFGGIDATKKLILSDFFRGAFDGSGADNFFQAGSCIDGRLTSAWNWCSQIEKKSYYNIFLLSGFMGFDGENFNS